MTAHDKKGVWKSGRGKGRKTPKGRQLDDAACAEVKTLLGDRPRRRDLLIEFLHLVQDEFGHIGAAHIRALAEEMRLSMAEVYEVASFYAHFDVVKENELPPPALTIRVCDSLSCELAGAQALQQALEDGLDPAEVRVVRAPCMGRCDTAPVVELGHYHIDHATPENIQAAINGTAEELEVGMGKVGMPLRVAVTGSGNSPSLDVTLNLLDKAKVAQRIDKALEFIAVRENS